MTTISGKDPEVDEVAEKLGGTQLDLDDHWDGYWEAAFNDLRGSNFGYHGLWSFHKDDTMLPTSKFKTIRSYKRSADGQTISFHNLFDDKPASGRAKQRADGLWEHAYERQLSEPYFSCNMQLGESEKAEGRPACFYWRSVPISGSAVTRIQPGLPTMEAGPLPPTPNPDFATTIWAMEGYLQDDHCRWSIGPIYSMQNLHLLTHMFIREYYTSADPAGNVDFAKQPMQEARGQLDKDPTKWMDGGTWSGTMTDLLWDEDGEMFKCSPRPAAWAPPAIATGRKSMDSLLALKRLFLYPDMMYGYFPERLPATVADAEKRRGVRLEIGGMMRNKQEFRRVILRYNATGEVASLTEEVYHPPS